MKLYSWYSKNSEFFHKEKTKKNQQAIILHYPKKPIPTLKLVINTNKEH